MKKNRDKRVIEIQGTSVIKVPESEKQIGFTAIDNVIRNAKFWILLIFKITRLNVIKPISPSIITEIRNAV